MRAACQSGGLIANGNREGHRPQPKPVGICGPVIGTVIGEVIGLLVGPGVVYPQTEDGTRS